MIWFAVALATFFSFIYFVDWSLWASVPVGFLTAIAVTVLLDLAISELKTNTQEH